MFNKQFLIIIILINPLLLIIAENTYQTTQSSSSSSSKFGSNCLIHNEAYRFEYLYSINENNKKMSSQKNVHLMPLSKVNDFNNLRWSLIETQNKSGQFYLKSSLFDDYLCASFEYGDLFRLRRKVMRIKINSTNLNALENCKWILKQVDLEKSNSRYLITNVLFDQALYAATYFFQIQLYKRDVFLWNKKNVNSKKFKWVIHCLTGYHLWI